jgi:signal transduction histidine kinase
MAARLEADEAQRRTLLADVTHELRTPLAVVQGNVEAILDGIHPADEAHLGAILEETRVLGRLVEDLRTLALSEAGSLSLHRETTDLEVLCGEVAAAFGNRRRRPACRSRRPSRATSRSSTSTRSGSARSSATSSETPCGTRRRADGSRSSPGRRPATGRARWS